MKNKSALIASVSFFLFLFCSLAVIFDFRVTPTQTTVEAGWSVWVWSAGVFAVVFLISLFISISNYMNCKCALKGKGKKNSDDCENYY